VGGPQSWFECHGEEKTLMLLPGIKPQILGYPGKSVKIPTSLFQLQCYNKSAYKGKLK
jgi:hypothetical protein